jgi:flavodoxin
MGLNETETKAQIKAMIVCVSASHGNTARVANVIGQVLQAPVVAPDDVEPAELDACELVGFGSGVFNMDLHSRLREFVASLPARDRGRAFVFTTSGLPEPPFRRYLRRFANALENKGFSVADTFACRGFDTWFPFRIVGGINKSHPDTADLDAARRFAEDLRARTPNTA